MDGTGACSFEAARCCIEEYNLGQDTRIPNLCFNSIVLIPKASPNTREQSPLWAGLSFGISDGGFQFLSQI
jgi:hypothetical protein